MTGFILFLIVHTLIMILGWVGLFKEIKRGLFNDYLSWYMAITLGFISATWLFIMILILVGEVLYS